MNSKIAGFLLPLLFLPFVSLAQSAPEAASGAASSTTATSTSPQETGNAGQTIQERVQKEFADVPVMVAIAKCESRFRQFTDSGKPLDGGAGGMIGIFQISKTVHAAFAASLGFDISTIEGNIGYARYLYSKEGTNPWVSSFPCWSSATGNPESTNNSPSASPGELTANLSFGMIHPQVLVLQQILNKYNFPIAQSGPGSAGNETNKFGFLTRETVRKFQCAKGIVCSGDEGSTGYGYVGARTRAALLGAAASDPVAIPTPPNEDTTAKIAALQEQITQYQKMIDSLQQQIAALHTQ